MALRLLKNPKIATELEKRTAKIINKTDFEASEIIAALCMIAFGAGLPITTGCGRLTCSDDIKAYSLRSVSSRPLIDSANYQKQRLRRLKGWLGCGSKHLIKQVKRLCYGATWLHHRIVIIYF
jgi:hypothetical protein